MLIVRGSKKYVRFFNYRNYFAKLDIRIRQAINKIFSNPGYSEKEEEKIDKLVEYIVNGKI